MEEDLSELKDLRFVFTDEMKETLFDMMTIQKMLETEELDKKQRKSLENEKQRLLENFRRDLQENNPVEVSIVRTFLNMKKEERK